MRRRTDGFTLVELMVVVLVIGILVAVAVPVFKAAKDNAIKNACLANQRMIISAMESYQADHPEWTLYGDPKAWGMLGEVNSEMLTPWTDRIVPEYIKAVPQCQGTTFSEQARVEYHGSYDRRGYQVYGGADRPVYVFCAYTHADIYCAHGVKEHRLMEGWPGDAWYF